MIEQGVEPVQHAGAAGDGVEVLRIVLSIGGTEVDHFGVWHDTAANAVEPRCPGSKTQDGTSFPNLKAQQP